jgi:type II secretory pathway component PulF
MAQTTISEIAMALYVQTMGVLVSSGIRVSRILDLLDETTDNPQLKAANSAVKLHVKAGDTLSDAMKKHPAAFSDFLVLMTRAGEVGGVLDVTLTRAADMLQRQLEWDWQIQLHRAVAKTEGTAVEARLDDAIASTADLSRLQCFCYMFADMLASGVPVLQALDVASEALEGEQAEAVRQAGADVRGRKSMTPALAPLGAVVQQLFAVGEETGSLDRTMLRAGDLLGRQIEACVLGALESEEG